MATFIWSFVSLKMYAGRHTLQLLITMWTANTCPHLFAKSKKKKKKIRQWRAFFLALVEFFFLRIFFPSLIRTLMHRRYCFLLFYHHWQNKMISVNSYLWHICIMWYKIIQKYCFFKTSWFGRYQETKKREHSWKNIFAPHLSLC